VRRAAAALRRGPPPRRARDRAGMVRAVRRRAPIGARTQLLTTRHAPALAPGLPDAGGTHSGVVVGTSSLGGPYRFDPFDAYAEGLVTNPNVLVAGQVGRGKSALVKCLLARALVTGRRCVVVDPKGEYASFAAAMGATPLVLEPGGTVRLNPLAGSRDDTDRPALLGALVAAGIALRRLVVGELRGMFDGPTSPGVHLDGDVVVLDVSGALRAGALPVVL